MSVTLSLAPDQFSFSNDFITAEFLCTNYLLQAGRAAISTLKFNSFPAAGGSFILSYGSYSIKLTSAVAPGIDGLEFPADAANAGVILPYLRQNYLLNRDFNITASGTDSIVFTSKNKTIGLDIAVSSKVNADVIVTNTQLGLQDIKKSNYSISFRLFIESIDNTAFVLAYESNLLMRNDRPGVAIAQIGDKLHQVIASDLMNFGIEIPTDQPLKCKKTCRRYYFEFAESFGDPITVQKLYTSTFFNVLFGGQSYQAKNSLKLQALLNPGTQNSDRFLKQGSAIQYSREDQPQFLFFYNIRNTAAATKLLAKRYFNDGTTDTTTLSTFTLEQGMKYGFNVSYGSVFFQTNKMDQYEVYLVNSFNERISEKQTYVINRDIVHFKRYFLNYSSWGSLDSRLFTGKLQNSFSLSYEKANRIQKPGYKLVDGASIIHSKSLIEKFKASTGFIDTSAISANKDFFLSLWVYRYSDQVILPIEITSSSIENPGDETFLCAQTFEYQYLFENDQYSETDPQDTTTLPSTLLPEPIGPIIIYAGTPANPSLNIVQQQIP